MILKVGESDVAGDHSYIDWFKINVLNLFLLEAEPRDLRYQTQPGNDEKTKKFAVGCVSLPQNEINVLRAHPREVLCKLWFKSRKAYNKPAFSYKSRMVLMIFCPYKGSEFQRPASSLTVGARPRLTKRKRTFSWTKGWLIGSVLP